MPIRPRTSPLHRSYMSNFWKLRRQLVCDAASTPVAWPAKVDLMYRLKPADLFGVPDEGTQRSTMSGETKFSINGETGKFTVLETGNLSLFHLDGTFKGGSLKIVGNEVSLVASVASESHLESLMNWAAVLLTQFLTVQIGAFVDIESVAGTVSGQKVAALYSAESYSILLASVDAELREERIKNALLGPSIENPSYSRFAASTSYFHHALRLISPLEVNYVPYSAHAEVLLNLAKSIEILFSAPSRDALRERLRELGYSDSQIESQIVPILLVRNEMDVGHPASGHANTEDVATLRRFVDRSLKNVAAILQTVWQRICSNQNYLASLPGDGDTDRARLTAKLKAYLKEPSLDPGARTPIIISIT
jgi:hypothetical protein